MRIASYRGEASLEDLVARLFPSSGDQRPAIARALLKTNPHLRDLQSLQEGAPILLGDDVPPSAEAQPLNPYAGVVAGRVAARRNPEPAEPPAPAPEPVAPEPPPPDPPAPDPPAPARRKAKKKVTRRG